MTPSLITRTITAKRLEATRDQVNDWISVFGLMRLIWARLLVRLTSGTSWSGSTTANTVTGLLVDGTCQLKVTEFEPCGGIALVNVTRPICEAGCAAPR